MDKPKVSQAERLTHRSLEGVPGGEFVDAVQVAEVVGVFPAARGGFDLVQVGSGAGEDEGGEGMTLEVGAGEPVVGVEELGQSLLLAKAVREEDDLALGVAGLDVVAQLGVAA